MGVERQVHMVAAWAILARRLDGINGDRSEAPAGLAPGWGVGEVARLDTSAAVTRS